MFRKHSNMKNKVLSTVLQQQTQDTCQIQTFSLCNTAYRHVCEKCSMYASACLYVSCVHVCMYRTCPSLCTMCMVYVHVTPCLCAHDCIISLGTMSVCAYRYIPCTLHERRKLVSIISPVLFASGLCRALIENVAEYQLWQIIRQS